MISGRTGFENPQVVEKLEEGPRIVRRSDRRCPEEMAGVAPMLTFTVTEEGRATDISGLNPQSTAERCAVEIIRDTSFKPETVNGRTVSSRVTRQIRFK